MKNYIQKMRLKILIVALIFLPFLILSFTFNSQIPECFINYQGTSKLEAATPDRLPKVSVKPRVVPTSNGDVEISVKDGYRVLYNNSKNAPFVNLKIELSDSKLYEVDKKNLLNNLVWMNTKSEGMETKDLIELEFNGYKVYGLSLGNIESGSILGTFVMFPENDIIVYFYFNNLKPEYRNFKSLEDYKEQRDHFMDEYTRHLNKCNKN
jgi:hypothetical protein